MAGFAQGSVELKHKTSGTNANIDHLRIYAKDDEYLFTVDNDGSERSLQYYHSTGVSDSILHDLVDNGNGTANISGCNVRLYKTTDFTGDLYEYYVSGVTLSFIDGLEQYVVADYNNGNPILRVESNKNNVNESNVSCLFCCWRQGNEIHSVGTDSKALGLSNKISRSITDTIPYRKSVDGGLIISETNIPTPRTILITSAVVYSGVIPNNILSFNSWVDRMTLAYHSGGNWLYVDEDLYNNTQYDDGANLQTIPNNKFAVRWYYRSIGDIKQTFYVLGKNYYNSITDARNEYVRNDLPIVIRKHCVLVGRSIIEYNALNGITEYVQDISFASTTTPNHNDLNNIQGGSLGNYYHVSGSTFGYLSAVSADIQQQLNSKISSAASPSNHNNLIGLQGGSSGNYYHVSGSTFGYLSAVSADIQQQLNSKISSELLNILQEPTGFFRKDDSVISMDASTMTFNISAVGSSYDILYRGTKYTKTSDTIELPYDQGLWFIYFTSAGILTATKESWELSETIPVSLIYQDVFGNVIIVGEERHGCVMDWSTHQYLHDNFGTRYTSGFSANYVLNSDTSAFFGLTPGKISDEDLEISIIQGVSGGYFTQQLEYQAFIPVYFKSGDDSTGATGLWRKFAATNLPYYGWTNQINYNYYVGGTWGQTTASINNFVAFYIFATNHKNEPIISIQGQREDISLDAAKNNNIPSNLILTDFPTKEAKLLYRIILKYNPSYTGNAYRVKIADVTDYRNSDTNITTLGSIGTVTYVALSGSSAFNIGGSPITNAGTFTIDFSAQNSGTFLSAPASTSGIPSFRKIVESDLPATYLKTSGGNVTGNLSALNFVTSGDILFRNSSSAFASIASTSANIMIRNLSANGSVIDYPIVIEKTGLERIQLGYSGKVRPVEIGGPVTIQNLSANGFIRSNSSGLLTTSPLTSGELPIHNQDFSTITNRTQDINAINERIETGFYQNSTPLTTSGWPVNGNWWHLLNLTHTNISNYYSLQIAADYYSQDFRIRSTNNNGLQSWSTIYTSTNLPSVLSNYLPLSGGTMTGDISFTNLTTGIGKGLYGTNGDNDHWRIVGGSNGLNQGYLEIATNDDKSEPIYIKQYQGNFSSPVSTRTLTLLDSNGNTLIPQTLSSTNYYNAGSYYVSNYAAGGNPSLITNQGVATFYTLTLDYYNTGERSLKFADSAYLGPTFASFFNNGSTQNNAIVVKGVGNNDYGGIYFGIPGINPRYIGTKGDNTLYIAGQYINSTGSFTQNGTSTFVGNTNIGRGAWPELYSITIYDKLYVSGTSTFSTLYVNGNSTFNNDVTFNNITTFSVSSTFAALAKFNAGQVLEPIYVNSTSYTATDTSPGFLAFSNTSTTATRITLSDSTRNGKLIMVFNYSGDSRYIESNVTNGLNIAAGTASTSKLMANGSLYLCIKLSSGTYSGGWKVREL